LLHRDGTIAWDQGAGRSLDEISAALPVQRWEPSYKFAEGLQWGKTRDQTIDSGSIQRRSHRCMGDGAEPGHMGLLD
jgi:hypothetical protein